MFAPLLRFRSNALARDCLVNARRQAEERGARGGRAGGGCLLCMASARAGPSVAEDRAEGQRHVFDGVVEVNFDVALGFDFEVE